MQKLLEFALAGIAVIALLNSIAVNNQIVALQDQVASQRAIITSLNTSLADTNDRLTFMAEKLNPLIAARCHLDQIFYSASEVPENYTGYVFVSFEFMTQSRIGVGIICR